MLSTYYCYILRDYFITQKKKATITFKTSFFLRPRLHDLSIGNLIQTVHFSRTKVVYYT